MARFELKSEDLQRLETVLRELPNKGEEEINKVLHKESAEKVIRSIQDLIKVSSWNPKAPKKKGTHARYGKPFRIIPFNLGFFIRTYPKYGYLVFPDEGRGIRNPVEQNFTGRGIEKERPDVVNRLMEVLTRKIEEEL